MRILMSTDTVGGVWTFTSHLSTEFLKRGHRVHLASLGRLPASAQTVWIAQQQARFGSSFTACSSATPLEWMTANEQAYTEGKAFLEAAAASFAPDVVLSSQFCFGRLDIPTPTMVVAHSDVLSWARACRPEGLESSPWLERYIAMVQGGLTAAAAVAAPSFTMAKALVDHFKAPHGVTVIPNGVAVAPGAEPILFRRLQAITAGRAWDEAKGHDVLDGLRAPFPVLLAGDLSPGTHGEPAWPPAGVEYLGCLSPSALHGLFRQSAVYLCTSIYEPFGLAAVEAALCGCAVVARDIPSQREVWQDGALFFHDRASLSALLSRLAADSTLLQQMQARARERAAEFTPERMAEGYLNLIGSVLRQREARAHVA